MSDNRLIPNYVDADFDTMKERLKTLLSKVDNFQDYDFEGANMTLLLELVSYVGDLNIFYTNRLAQNIHTETADIYEVVHSLVRQQGYTPSGYVSSEVTLTVRIRRRNDEQNFTYFNVGHQLYIPRWFKVNTGLSDDAGNIIYYCMPTDYTYTVAVEDIKTAYDSELALTYDYVEFDIIMKQGEPLQSALEYTGADIISNQIVLPFDDWDMGLYPYEEIQESLLVTVGESETVWVRISDFFDELSGLSEENNAYLLSYDKYKRAVLSFSNTRNIPEIDDDIKVYLIKSLGSEGVISRNTFTAENKPITDTILGVPDVAFITNISSAVVITEDRYTVVNNVDSVGGSNPPDIDELKEGGDAYSHSQLRNVTKTDYIGNLNARGDVAVANAWGEQEENPGVLTTTNYNRAYISIIPTEWENGVDNNIRLESVSVSDDFSNNPTGDPAKELDYPVTYNAIGTLDVFVNTINGTLVDGTYNGVATDTDGVGVGATVDVLIESLAITSIILNSSGSGYLVGDSISILGANVSWTDDPTDTFVSSVLTLTDTVFNPNWQTQLLSYLEPRKMFGIWEEFKLPETVYFRMDFGLKVRRSYSWVDVKETVKNKLIYYFRVNNKSFGDTIDFREVSDYILDTGNISPTDDFVLVRGIKSLVVRDVLIHRDTDRVGTIAEQESCEDMGGTWTGSCSIVPDEMYIYPDNVYNYFPHFVDTGYFRSTRSTVDDVYNIIQPIKLGHNQFPILASDFCMFVNEG